MEAPDDPLYTPALLPSRATCCLPWGTPGRIRSSCRLMVLLSQPAIMMWVSLGGVSAPDNNRYHSQDLPHELPGEH
ncbi:hypothetical protein Pcinc_008765 [Petrolisthes cinctipes]|uniref:Uncharacterized protein n=1 Tax=Petrolisthes cinctipes TaxID=88211 RepID=A0AAE1G5Z5_PETCI|nr:hypothetical protein Pcinc_008765 [Petrolisthes cinctipes]